MNERDDVRARAPVVVLPVETMAREWDGKLLLAAFLARDGAQAIVGSHARINNRLHRLPADVYVSQTIVKPKRRIFRIIRQTGLRLAAWDEEGLVWATPEFYRWRRLDVENWRMVQRFFCWGEVQANAIRDTFDDANEKLRITGNPRQDFYTPRLRPLHEEGVRRIREQYGRFILVNSNFGSLHSPRLPFQGIEKTPQALQALARASGHKPEYIAFRQQVFLSLCELVRELSSAFANRTIVIRPHPSERRDAWEQLAESLPNVVVKYDHELIPWLLAADAVIHNGCTTAVETAMLGRPAIEYRAVELGEWESAIVSGVSIPARSPEEVIALLADEQAMVAARADIEPVLRRYITHHHDGFASERIAAELLRLAAEPAPPTTAASRLAGRLKSRLRGAEKAITGRLRPNTSASPAYIDKKFPATSTQEVRDTLQELCALTSLPVPRVEELGDRIWRISPEQ